MTNRFMVLSPFRGGGRTGARGKGPQANPRDARVVDHVGAILCVSCDFDWALCRDDAVSAFLHINESQRPMKPKELGALFCDHLICR